MNDRPQRTYYRSLVNNIHALPGLGSDFHGVVSLDPSSPENAEYLGSFTTVSRHLCQVPEKNKGATHNACFSP